MEKYVVRTCGTPELSSLSVGLGTKMLLTAEAWMLPAAIDVS